MSSRRHLHDGLLGQMQRLSHAGEWTESNYTSHKQRPFTRSHSGQPIFPETCRRARVSQSNVAARRRTFYKLHRNQSLPRASQLFLSLSLCTYVDVSCDFFGHIRHTQKERAACSRCRPPPSCVSRHKIASGPVSELPVDTVPCESSRFQPADTAIKCFTETGPHLRLDCPDVLSPSVTGRCLGQGNTRRQSLRRGCALSRRTRVRDVGIIPAYHIY